jgi:hypothetical protein
MFNARTPAGVARTFFNRSASARSRPSPPSRTRVDAEPRVELDVPLLPTAIAAGASTRSSRWRRRPPQQGRGSRQSVTSTDFAGHARSRHPHPFFSGIGFRGDLRLPIVFSDGDTRLHFLAEGGIYVSF